MTDGIKVKKAQLEGDLSSLGIHMDNDFKSALLSDSLAVFPGF